MQVVHAHRRRTLCRPLSLSLSPQWHSMHARSLVHTCICICMLALTSSARLGTHAHGRHGRRQQERRQIYMLAVAPCITVRSVQGYSSSQLRRRPCRRTRACTRPPSTETRQLLCPDHWLNTVKIRPCIYVSFTNNNKKKITTIGPPGRICKHGVC